MAETAETEIPFWVKDTLPEHMYRLTLFESSDNAAEEVELTRAEFIALKKYLAAMRGYGFGDVLVRVTSLNDDLPGPYQSTESQQTARHLESARDLFRQCFDLVVFESEELDGMLKRLAE